MKDPNPRVPVQSEGGLTTAQPMVLPHWRAQLDTDSAEADEGRDRTLFAPGTRFGDYELIAKIAQGGMGVVYKARQISLNRIVALKMILDNRLENPVDLQRFRIEAEAAASLDHPRLVPIYEVGEIEGQHYFTMKYIEGGSLDQHLERYRKDHKAAARLILSASRGLHTAHQAGILHRDLKPANILVCPEGRPHITDFGVAKRLSGSQPDLDVGQIDDSTTARELTLAGDIVGTPSYMAPEQASGKASNVSAAADIFSMGAILYEMLTGRPPYREISRLATIRKVLTEPPLPPRKLNRWIDLDLSNICMKCLGREPEDRYQSADALADDLERWLNDQHVHATPRRWIHSIYKWIRKRPAITSLIAMIVVLVVVSSSGMFWFWRRVEQAHEQVSTQQELARVAQAREGRLRYLHQIHQVQRLQRKNQIERIEPFLDTMDPAHRAWEWQYLKTYCQTRVQVLDPDLVGGHRVHFMGNSQRVLLETMDHRLQIWNTLKREKVRDLVSAKVKVVRFALSPKGNLLATAQDDGMVRVWDLQTGAERISFGKFAAPPECLAFSADGQSLAFPARRTMPDGTVRSTFLMATLDSSKPPITQVMPAQILCVAPLGSGEWITGSDDRCLRIWRDGGVQRTMSGHTGDVIAVACPPRGNLIASAGSDHKIRFWDVAGRDLFEINAHTDRIKALCFAPDGSQLISASSDRTLRVWNARSGQAVLMLRFPEPLTSIDLSPDGQHLVSATAKTPVELWKAYWYESIMPTLSGRSIRSAARLPDGRWALLQSDRSLELLDLQSTPKTTPLRWNGKRPQEIAVCAATKMLAVGSEDSTVGLIDLKTESQANSFETNHQGGLHHLQFRPNGTQLATAGEEPVIKLWDPTSPRDPLILRGHSQRIKAIRFAPTGRWLATASEDRDVIIWDTNSGSEVKRLQIPSEKPTALAFSPDGKILAVGGSEGSIYVSMWGTGDELPTLRDHVGAINALVFTPEGDRLVSSGAELAIKFWDHTLGEETLTLLGHVRPILQMEFDVKDRSLNSVGDDLAIQSWQVQPVGK